MNYIGAPSHSAPVLLRRADRVIRAELSLRLGRPSRSGVTLVHREISPLSRGRVELRAIGCAPKSIYDFDDALQWQDVRRHPVARAMLPKGRKIEQVVAAVDRVIAGNEVLADWAAAFAADVRVIPSCVNVQEYATKVDYEIMSPPRIVWMGSLSTERFLLDIAKPLHELNRAMGLELWIVGHPLGDKRLAPLGGLVRRVPWTEETQRTILATCDVGIMPLPEGSFERGKCAYKLLQYGASALPFVASPVGVNATLLSDIGLPGPNTPGDWFHAIRELLAASREERRVLGERAQRYVEERYSYRRWESEWLDAVTTW